MKGIACPKPHLLGILVSFSLLPRANKKKPLSKEGLG
jgi:hypothetical protein